MTEPLAFPQQSPQRRQQIALEELHTAILDCAAKTVAIKENGFSNNQTLIDGLSRLHRNLCFNVELVEGLEALSRWQSL